MALNRPCPSDGSLPIPVLGLGVGVTKNSRKPSTFMVFVPTVESVSTMGTVMIRCPVPP